MSILLKETRFWYYVLCDSPVGPIAEKDFLRYVESGKIPLNTEAWHKGLKHWTPLCQLLPEITPKQAQTAGQAADVDNQRPAPWLRLLARALDTIILLPLISTIMAYLPLSDRLNDVTFIMLAMLLAMLLEACALSALGTTFGKSLLGIRITQQNGENLTFAQAVKRSSLAWVMGTGLFCSWAISIAFCWASYKLLKHRGATLWDLDAKHQLHYNPPGLLRRFATSSAVSGLSCICLLLI